MTRRAAIDNWVAARLVALTLAFSLTALQESARAALLLLLAQVGALAIARLIAPSGSAMIAVEVALTTAALAATAQPPSPFFAAVPLVALWALAHRNTRSSITTGLLYLSILWANALAFGAPSPSGSLILLSAGAVAITASSTRLGRAPQEGSPEYAYALLTQVLDLSALDADPVLVARELLDEVRRITGQRDLIVQSPDGQVLASIGNEWEHTASSVQRLEVHHRSVALLLSPVPLPSTQELRDLLNRRAIALGTALAFAQIRSMASDAERSRLSREMHDGIAQEIASLGYELDDLLGEAPDEARPRLREVRARLTRIVSDLRLSIFELRGRDHGSGLGAALSELIDRTQPDAGVAIHLRLDEAPTRFPRAVEDELLRIAQEALANARRHSGASNVWISAHLHPPVAELTIEDDGIGLTPGRRDSYGLEVMRERATGINASLTIRDRHGGGTVVYLLLNPSTIPS